MVRSDLWIETNTLLFINSQHKLSIYLMTTKQARGFLFSQNIAQVDEQPAQQIHIFALSWFVCKIDVTW